MNTAKRPGAKLPSSPLKKMMSIHPPHGTFITVLFKDPYGEWIDIPPEHFVLPCLSTSFLNFAFYEVRGVNCESFSGQTEQDQNVARFAAVLVNDMGDQKETCTELARQAEKYKGRIALDSKHITILYALRD